MSQESSRLEAALKLLLGREPLVQALGDSLPAGIFVTDPSGRCIYSNPRFQAICGQTFEGTLGDGWLMPIAEDDRERIAREWDDVRAREGEWVSVYRCRTDEGTLCSVSVRAAPLRDRHGRLAGYIGAAEDVSTRVRLEAKFSALFAASRMLLESPRLGDVLPATLTLAQQMIQADGYAVWRLSDGAEWRIAGSTGISPSFAQAAIQSYQGEPVTVIPFSAPLAVEDVAASPLLAERQATYRAEGIRSMLVVPLNISGALSGALVFYYRSPQRFDDIRTQAAAALGNLAAVAISTAGLYEEQLALRERAEHAHEQASLLAEASRALGSSLDYEATLRTVAQLAVPRIADWCAVDVLDDQGALKRLAVAHVDPAKVEFARSLRERYPEDPESPQGIHAVLRTRQPAMISSIDDDMLVHAARDQEHLAILRALGLTSYIAVPLVAHGRALGVMSFVTAESGRRYAESDLQFAQAVAERAALAVDNARAYREARAANRAKDEFLATLSHELRTPINAIMGWAQMLQHGVVDPARFEHAVDAIVRNAAAQSRLIEDLLDLSRIVSGRLRLDVELLDLSAVVAAAVLTIEPAAQAKGLRVQTVADQGNARVYGDRQRLQQAVWNLLSNAVKFTPRGGRIQIQVLRVNSHVEVAVSDTGEGIAPDVLPFVFDRFRQADSSSTRRHTGLGLGLAIVRHIVELHGGTVEVASAGTGTGATFRLKLPLSVAKTEMGPSASAPATAPAHPATPAVETASLAADALPDLADTYVLVVEDEPDAREMVGYLLRQRNAEVAVAASMDEALTALDVRVPDVLISDIEMPDRDGYDLIRAVRARSVERGGQVAAAALTAYSRAEDRARTMLAGYDAHLSKPVDLAELMAVIARLRARARRGEAAT